MQPGQSGCAPPIQDTVVGDGVGIDLSVISLAVHAASATKTEQTNKSLFIITY